MSIRKTQLGHLSAATVANQALTAVVNQFFDDAGGLDGLRRRLEAEDLGHVYQTWISSHKKPSPTTPGQMRRVLGNDARRLAETHAIDESALLDVVAQHLPEKVRQAAREEKPTAEKTVAT